MKKTALARKIEQTLDALDALGVPSDVMCTQFGAHFRIGMFSVAVSDHHKSGSDTLFMFTHHGEHKFSKKVFDYIRRSLSDIAPIESTWNGEDGQPMISVVIKRRLPKVIIHGVSKYRACDDVFTMTPQEQTEMNRFSTLTQQVFHDVGGLGY